MTYREFCTQIVPMVNELQEECRKMEPGRIPKIPSGSLWKHLLSDQKSAETLWKQFWI